MKARVAVAAMMLIAATAGCKIATVRRLDDRGPRPDATASPARPFDAAAAVTAAWDAELLPAIAHARDLTGLSADEAVTQPVVTSTRDHPGNLSRYSRSTTLGLKDARWTVLPEASNASNV